MWGDRETAIGAGFDCDVVRERAARVRQADASVGRAVDIPLYWRVLPGGVLPRAPGLREDRAGEVRGTYGRREQGLRVVCGDTGRLDPWSSTHPRALGGFEEFWESVSDRLPSYGEPREVVTSGWERVGVPLLPPAEPVAMVQLVARDTDWDLIATCLPRTYGGLRTAGVSAGGTTSTG